MVSAAAAHLRASAGDHRAQFLRSAGATSVTTAESTLNLFGMGGGAAVTGRVTTS